MRTKDAAADAWNSQLMATDQSQMLVTTDVDNRLQCGWFSAMFAARLI